jgi:hypothetical protein
MFGMTPRASSLRAKRSNLPLFAKIKDIVTGKRDDFNKKFTSAYGEGDYAERIGIEKQRIYKNYLYLLIIGIAIIAALTLKGFFQEEVPEKIKRGTKQEKIMVNISASKDGEKIQKEETIKINPKKLSSEQKIVRINSLINRLPKIILGENKSLKNICFPLDLITKDKKSGATIVWESGNEKAISNNGVPNSLYAKMGEEVVFTAKVSIGEYQKKTEYEIIFGNVSEQNLLNELGQEVANEVEEVNNSDENDYLFLPKKTEGGASLSYSNIEDKTILIVFLLIIFMATFIYFTRFKRVDKILKKEKEEIIYAFPAFVQKFVLLLNAGQTVFATFQKITDEYQKEKYIFGKKVLYEELIQISEKIKNSGERFAPLFSDFAKRTGKREIMRFSSIVSANIDKGSVLTEKLEDEMDILFEGRKRAAKEKGELAESKLILPMMLLLIVILLITIGPVGAMM